VANTTAEKTEDHSEADREAEQKAEQKALLERIATSDREKAAEKAADKVAEKSEKTEKASAKGEKLGSGKREPIGTTKSLPSPFRSIGVMLFLLGVFGIFVMFLKRMKNGAAGKSAKAARGGLGGFLNKLSGTGAAKQMIEVVATHHLAPKRSIVVVRVQDRMLVLGMTNDSVNLITEFKANEEGEAEENIGIGDFAASLKKFENEGTTNQPSIKLSGKANLGDIAAAALGLGKPRPASAPKASMAANAYQATSQGPSPSATPAKGPVFSPAIAAALNEPSIKPSIRAQIKDRVQGMKQL
jgi:flagellar biogenesis protein FliO